MLKYLGTIPNFSVGYILFWKLQMLLALIVTILKTDDILTS